MVIFNITTLVSWPVAAEWLAWQRSVHIPEMMDTNLFYEHKIYRLMEQEDEQGPTYIIQYYASSMLNYQAYVKEFAPLFDEKIRILWKDSFVSFHSAMEVVH